MIASPINDHACLGPTIEQNVTHIIERLDEGTHRGPAENENKDPGRAMLDRSANDNAPTSAVARCPTVGRCDAPLLELRPVGDGRAFIRTLARVIVRRELIFAGLIAAPDPCASEARDRMIHPPGGVES